MSTLPFHHIANVEIELSGHLQQFPDFTTADDLHRSQIGQRPPHRAWSLRITAPASNKMPILITVDAEKWTGFKLNPGASTTWGLVRGDAPVFLLGMSGDLLTVETNRIDGEVFGDLACEHLTAIFKRFVK